MAEVNTVDVMPTKRFFVSMLTRDIQLQDAIMDLIDNCVDGVLRQLHESKPEKRNSDKPYSGFWARVVANPQSFSITDNCGGIPREIARNSAFRLGRLDTDLDKDIATVGMYGIGMKRALFKMGQHSRVYSRHRSDAYSVEIRPDWLEADNNWKLEIQDSPNGLEGSGTKIEITQLYDAIAREFNQDMSTFLEKLKEDICSFYALILHKGFSIYVNDDKLEPIDLDILLPKDFQRDSIGPYAYKDSYEGVDIELFVGFYRNLASETEIDAEQRTPRSKDNAGWTIICNDRVVLHHDKSAVTGWGIAGVPKYHNQFIAISGVVHFRSNQPLSLPLNTTKRGLDTSSRVYWHVLQFMREGLKKFTDFTNQWKGREDETIPRFALASAVRVTDVIRSIPDSAWTRIRGQEAQRYLPVLPRPSENRTQRRISFLRLTKEVERLGVYFFDDANAQPSEIGNRCFEDSLAIAEAEEKSE